MEHIAPPLALTTSEFTYSPRSRTFSAEASDFGVKFRVPATVVLTSHWTGQTRQFRLAGRQVDRLEGELLGWVYEDSVSKTRIVFYND